jgi:lipoprotein-releasing system ATP-binding protein
VADPVLALEGIRKAYNVGAPNEVEVLHGIDLTVEHGEFCALMGPSGSGKSTLLNIIGLLDRPTGGRLFVAGHETARLDDAGLTRLRGHNIGFVFQYHHLLPAFTATENVMMPMLLERGHPDAAMRARAEQLLESVGLAPWRNSLAINMSGGQQQRVAVARALAMNPPLLLADEPTGNLDTKSAQGVFDLIREVNRAYHTTVLLVTHNNDLSAQCDRILRLVDGWIDGHADASPGAAAPGRSAPDRTATDRTAPDHTAPDHTAPDHTAPDHIAPDRTAAR